MNPGTLDVPFATAGDTAGESGYCEAVQLSYFAKNHSKVYAISELLCLSGLIHIVNIDDVRLVLPYLFDLPNVEECSLLLWVYEYFRFLHLEQRIHDGICAS